MTEADFPKIRTRIDSFFIIICSSFPFHKLYLLFRFLKLMLVSLYHSGLNLTSVGNQNIS